MKSLAEIDLGYGDATNYRKNKRMAQMFNEIFVKDRNLERLLQEDSFFLIGEKGTGKTAYATFLENREYKNTVTKVYEISSTDFQIFLRLQKSGYLQLSDFTKVWEIILLMLMASEINKRDIDEFGPKRSEKLYALKASIEDYYEEAFIPEISNTFKYILDNTDSIEARVKSEILSSSAQINAQMIDEISQESAIRKFQNNLLDLKKDFESAFQRLKINKNRFIILDSVDINLSDFTTKEYEECLRALANAIWSVNTTVFRNMPESSKGFLKIVFSVRPDIFSKLNLHNQANKVRDNGIVLDWRTTYESFEKSLLYKLCNRLLSYDNPGLDENEYWNYYFPWYTMSTKPTSRDKDFSFINCLRLSLSRPRDMISIMKAIQRTSEKNEHSLSELEDFQDNATQNEISNYYVEEARDWCLYKFSGKEFESLLFFFQFLNGRSRFSYTDYEIAFNNYIEQICNREMDLFNEMDNKDDFLQLLYDLNMICYYDKDKNGNDLYRFCYREREIYNLAPKVKTGVIYGVHYALLKSLNLGKNSLENDF